MKAMYVTMTAAGTIYTTDISSGMGPERIAPDESYLVFARRIGRTRDSALMVSHRNPDGSWGEPRAVDLGMTAGAATVSPDGRFLFFSGGKPPAGDIYWVSASVLGAGARRD